MKDLKRGDKVVIKARNIECVITGIENNTSGTWYYLESDGEAAWNRSRDCSYFLAEELEPIIILTYTHAIQKNDRVITYKMDRFEQARQHYIEMIGNPILYLNLTSTYKFT